MTIENYIYLSAALFIAVMLCALYSFATKVANPPFGTSRAQAIFELVFFVALCVGALWSWYAL